MRLISLFLIGVICIATSAAAQGANPQMRLIDDLDYPGEGYCIDVRGVGQTARTDLPLVMHNCLPDRRSTDRMAVLRNGRIEMPAYDACVTALGGFNVLPGIPVMLRPCGTSESFLPAERFQTFERTDQNQLRLSGSSLCLAAGAVSDRTFSPSDRWRNLTLEPCNEVPLSLSAWQ